jgi:hypothetical protein
VLPDGLTASAPALPLVLALDGSAGRTIAVEVVTRAGAGTARVERITDALLRSEIVFSYVLRNVKVLPPRSLPLHALVIAITPLLDDRAAAALADLRARGHDLVVVEVSPRAVPAGAERPDGRARRAAVGAPARRAAGEVRRTRRARRDVGRRGAARGGGR